MHRSSLAPELACFSYGTGSNHEGVSLLLQIGCYRILLDCGLWDLAAIAPNLDEIDLVWCSHAHPDHARGLRQLHTMQPDLPIFASAVTRRLLPLNWPDQSHPLAWVTALPWRVPTELLPGLTAVLIPAGHLPGAAILQLILSPNPATGVPSRTVMYTGDFTLSGMRCVEGLPLDELRKLRPDVLILEGSYGTARFPRRRQLENQLIDRILQAFQSGQSILLPLAPIGMGPELLLLLRSHHRLTGQALEIWVDADIARSCDAYLELLPEFPSNIQNFARYQSLFWDERIGPWVKRLPVDGDWRRTAADPPCLILTSNKTAWWDYQALLPDSTLVLFSSKLDAAHPASPFGNRLEPELTRLQWEPIFLSEHCDLAGTLQVIHSLRPQHLVFMHGTPSFLADLSSLDELSNRYQIHTPQVGSRVELPIGELFHQPPPPEQRYLGELTPSSSAAIHLTLPPELMLDPRWTALADTGLLDVRWQGNSLILKGITPQELTQRHRDWPRDWQAYDLGPNCGTCRYYHRQHCRNLDSALAGLQVARDGYCPMHEAI